MEQLRTNPDTFQFVYPDIGISLHPPLVRRIASFYLSPIYTSSPLIYFLLFHIINMMYREVECNSKGHEHSSARRRNVTISHSFLFLLPVSSTSPSFYPLLLFFFISLIFHKYMQSVKQKGHEGDRLFMLAMERSGSLSPSLALSCLSIYFFVDRFVSFLISFKTKQNNQSLNSRNILI